MDINFTPYVISAVAVLVYVHVWYVIARIIGRNDVADIAWGLGFVLVAWVNLFLNSSVHPLSLMMTGMVTIWGVRLSWHIFQRNRRKAEDGRYATWRTQWGKWAGVRTYLLIFILQGVLLYIISLPIIAAHGGKLSLSLIAIAGVLIWLFGFFFESVADHQLARFAASPENKGKLLQTGLWKYSRHPNYFGEIVLWWGIYAMVSPVAWWTIIGPITITYLIVFVSGVPLLERKYAGRPDFEIYKQKTSVLIPLPPRT